MRIVVGIAYILMAAVIILLAFFVGTVSIGITSKNPGGSTYGDILFGFFLFGLIFWGGATVFKKSQTYFGKFGNEQGSKVFDDACWETRERITAEKCVSREEMAEAPNAVGVDSEPAKTTTSLWGISMFLLVTSAGIVGSFWAWKPEYAAMLLHLVHGMIWLALAYLLYLIGRKIMAVKTGEKVFRCADVLLFSGAWFLIAGGSSFVQIAALPANYPVSNNVWIFDSETFAVGAILSAAGWTLWKKVKGDKG